MASFRKRNNKWEYRLSVKEVQSDGEIKYRTASKGGFNTKKEAELAAAKRQQAITSESPAHHLTVAEFVRSWYKRNVENNDDYARNTRKNYNEAVELHVVKGIGHLQMKELTPQRYQRFINNELEQFSVGTVRRIHATVRLAFKEAIINGELQNSPVQYAKIEKRERKKLKYLEPSYIPKVLEFIYRRNFDQGIFFECLFESGMRKGECAALQLDDIDWKNNTLRVDETYDFHADARFNEIPVGRVKTESSERVLVMRKDFMDKLKMYVKHRMEKRMMMGSLFKSEYNFIFGHADGRAFPKSTIRATFCDAIDFVGHEPLPIHSTRHTHAVMMLEAGASMKEVQERLGHSSMQITADTYSHVTKKMQVRAVGLFDEYMKKNKEI